MNATPALRIQGLVKHYRRGLFGSRNPVPAVAGVDLEVGPGETLALVGESGSGKTTLARCALGLQDIDAGSIELLGQRLAALRGAALDRFRHRVQPLFQDADAHLNPGLRVRRILAETARLHRPGEPEAALIDDVLQQVGLTARAHAWPHELSGGERRRVGIARLLLCRPELVIADEPTAGLDAARKADVMGLLLASEKPRATLIISHDLPLVAAVADRMVVMLAGRVIERMPTATLAGGAHHPYTAELLAAAGLHAGEPPVVPTGTALGASSPGCPFVGRCALELPRCRTERPRALEQEPGHTIACHAVASDGSAGAPSR